MLNKNGSLPVKLDYDLYNEGKFSLSFWRLAPIIIPKQLIYLSTIKLTLHHELDLRIRDNNPELHPKLEDDKAKFISLDNEFNNKIRENK